MIKHFFAPWLCAAFCLVAVCGSHQSAQAASKNVKLAFVTNNASDFWTIARAGCTQASKDLTLGLLTLGLAGSFFNEFHIGPLS